MSYTTPLFRQTRRPHVYTFQDALDHMTNLYDIDNAGRHLRIKRQSVIEAWNDLHQLSDWTHLSKTGQIVTAAAYGTGTIQYVHSSRTMTLTGGTWPSDILSRRIVISNTSYPVESQTSSTVIVLPEAYNPGADLAAGTSYMSVRSEYPIDVNFSQIGPLRPVQGGVIPQYILEGEFQSLRMRLGQPGTPIYYTIRGSSNFINQPVFDFMPAPSTPWTYQYWGQTKMRALRTWGTGSAAAEYTTGTVTVSASETVTGSGTAWTSDMIGCVMRFTQSTTVLPSGLVGTEGRDNPYSEFRVVKSVTDGTTLVLDEPVEGSYSATKYSISDPVEVPVELWNLFLRLCERKSANLIPKMDQLSLRQANYQEALRLARAEDGRHIPSQKPDHIWTLEEYARNSAVDDTGQF